jgi:hypothetical protein
MHNMQTQQYTPCQYAVGAVIGVGLGIGLSFAAAAICPVITPAAAVIMGVAFPIIFIAGSFISAKLTSPIAKLGLFVGVIGLSLLVSYLFLLALPAAIPFTAILLAHGMMLAPAALMLLCGLGCCCCSLLQDKLS